MDNRRARVYVPTRLEQDYQPAVKYGDLVFLTQGPQNKYAVEILYDTIKREMIGAEEQDYLLVNGLSIINSISASILAIRFGRVNFLIWKHTEQQYMPKSLYFSDEPEN